jgi:hypothetical protein
MTLLVKCIRFYIINDGINWHETELQNYLCSFNNLRKYVTYFSNKIKQINSKKISRRNKDKFETHSTHIYMTSHFSSLIGTGTVVGFNKFYVPKYAVKYTNIVKSKGQYFM